MTVMKMNKTKLTVSVLALFLLLIILPSAIPAGASDLGTSILTDDRAGLLGATSLEKLTNRLDEFSDETGMYLSILIRPQDEPSDLTPYEYAGRFVENSVTLSSAGGMVILLDLKYSSSFYFYTYGVGSDIFTLEFTDELNEKLRDEVDDGELFILFDLIIDEARLAVLRSGLSTSLRPRVTDNCGLLSSDETAELEKTMEELRIQYDFDIIIVTEDYLGNKTPGEYADIYYGYGGYDLDKNGGLLLLIVPGRENGVYAYGRGRELFTDYGCQTITALVSGKLEEEKFAAAFRQFLSLAGDFLGEAERNEPYDNSNRYHTVLSRYIEFIAILFSSLALSAAITGFTAYSMNPPHVNTSHRFSTPSFVFRQTDARDIPIPHAASVRSDGKQNDDNRVKASSASPHSGDNTNAQK